MVFLAPIILSRTEKNCIWSGDDPMKDLASNNAQRKQIPDGYQ
jgi:hypothetical protein